MTSGVQTAKCYNLVLFPLHNRRIWNDVLPKKKKKKNHKYTGKVHAQQCFLSFFLNANSCFGLPLILTCYSSLYISYNCSSESCCIQKQEMIIVLIETYFLQTSKPEEVD